MTYPPTQEMTREYERIDALVVEGIEFADKRCRPLRMGGKEWSPALSYAKNILRLCRMIIKKREIKQRGAKLPCNMTRRIRRLQRKVGDNYLKFLTLEELIVTETQLKKKERRASKMAKVNRTHFLQDLAEARAKDGKTTAAKALAQLQLEEESRQSHRRVKAVNGKLRSTKPLVLYKRLVDDDGIKTTVALDTKAEQEKEALWHFAERCQGTVSSPPMTSPLFDELGYLSATHTATDILQGIYQPHPALIQPTVDYLRHVKYIPPPSGFKDWDGTITTASHVQGVKRLRERTSPGPSGITAAHWKASLDHPGLTSLDAAMRNFVCRSGYSSQRHRRSTAVILENEHTYIRTADSLS